MDFHTIEVKNKIFGNNQFITILTSVRFFCGKALEVDYFHKLSVSDTKYTKKQYVRVVPPFIIALKNEVRDGMN